ncbi:hypothetical protein ACIBO5_39315 [Nonomuraea angiospora]|uniref:hypothetical protein n=1 Tax=Nonomuraea angiospora TaxID=46172 RepID=UPI0037B03CDE
MSGLGKRFAKGDVGIVALRDFDLEIGGVPARPSSSRRSAWMGSSGTTRAFGAQLRGDLQVAAAGIGARCVSPAAGDVPCLERSAHGVVFTARRIIGKKPRRWPPSTARPAWSSITHPRSGRPDRGPIEPLVSHVRPIIQGRARPDRRVQIIAAPEIRGVEIR